VTVLQTVLVVLAVVVVVVFIGGLLAAARRDRRLEPRFSADVARADAALELARATDRGWDRAALERAVRRELAASRPDAVIEELHLVLVEDLPGIEGDQARFSVTCADGTLIDVLLTRGSGDWAAALR